MSHLLGFLYGSNHVRDIFSARASLQAWLDVERALAEAEADVGVIPRSAAERIAQEADASKFDLAALRTEIEATDHPLVPLVRTLADRCGDEGSWVHWGATTQDILDTALVLQARRASAHIENELERAIRAAAELTRRYRSTPMAGRTHGQHAVPITFGLKVATWCDELGRARRRLSFAREGMSIAQLFGAAGTLATLGDSARAVQEAFCRKLDLACADVHWHATRDRLRDLVHALNQIASAGERIASEIIRLQATEIAEAAEPASAAHVGSSTMPQKRNPMTCEYIVASARLLRGAAAVLIDSPAHLHERDMAFWAAEWIALPEAMILTGGVTTKLAHVLEGLEVDEERMRDNLELTRGQIGAEAVMMALAGVLGHEQAHAVVAAAAKRATAERRAFKDVLTEDPRVTDCLAPAALDGLLDPQEYLGLASSAADFVAARIWPID